MVHANNRLMSLFKKKNRFSKTSFSQCGEDLIVKHIFDQLKLNKPTFLDIGAHHPYYLSNTALFYQLGSHGVNIEPDTILFKEFVRNRKGDINLNIGISDEDGDSEFYIMNVPTLNTFSKEEAMKYQQHGYKINKVELLPTKSITNVIKEYCNDVFPDFISIDAEGVDELIIDSIDFNVSYPKVICVETVSFSNTGRGVKNENIINKIQSHNYYYYADTNINSIFVRNELWIR